MKNNIEKNILDLKHSFNLSKASNFLALGFSSWLAIFFGMKQFYKNINAVIGAATIVSIIFFYYAIKYFKDCENIHDKIKNLED